MSFLKYLNNSTTDSIASKIESLLEERKRLEHKKSLIENEIAPQTKRIFDLILEIESIRSKESKASRVLAIKLEEEKKKKEIESMEPREMTVNEIEDALGQKIIIVDR